MKERKEYLHNVLKSNPHTPNRTLARFIYDNRRDLFKSLEIARSAIRALRGANGKQLREEVSVIYDNPNTKQMNNAKILLFDIETAPITAYLWSKWQKSVNDDMIISDWFVICWSAKWLFEDKTISAKLTEKEIKAGNDKRIIESLWQLLDEADIVIAHNLEKFDRKKANTRFLKHDLKLPSPYQTIDTLIHARKQFAITSNRLDYIASRFFEIEGKMETKRGLWQAAMTGDETAIKEMSEYCDQDVLVLEDVYIYLRPYIQPHPNIGLFAEGDDQHCTHCGHSELSHIGNYNTYVNSYDAYRCNDCGAISRGRKTITPIKSKSNLTIATPK